MREVQRDIDGTCDAVAAPLAELFSFLGSHALLRCRLLAARLTSFCSNMRTSETSQAQAAARPAADRVEVPERTPDVKPLSLMQTVIMFFARGLAFGKPEFRLVTPMSIFSCPDRTKSYRTIWPSRPSESCPKGWPGAPPQVERSTFTSSVVANAQLAFFLHGWRRHVCRECTGNLVLLEGESSARPKQQTKQNDQQPETNKQTQGQSLAKSNSSEHARVKQVGGKVRQKGRKMDSQCSMRMFRNSKLGSRHAERCETLYCLCSSLCA